jgi:hypothetical protein
MAGRESAEVTASWAAAETPAMVMAHPGAVIRVTEGGVEVTSRTGRPSSPAGWAATLRRCPASTRDRSAASPTGPAA